MLKKRDIVVCVLVVIVIAAYLVFNRSNKQAGGFVHPSEIKDEHVVVHISTDQTFSPETIKVKKGTTVVFYNRSGNFVWPASDLHPTHNLYSEFDPLEPIPSEQAWAFTFDRVGEWKYHDHLRSNRRGIISVVEQIEN